MLNPSTADASQDDPTVRRVVGFSKKWGMGGAIVANLFALRSPSPRDLALAAERGEDPVGPYNDYHLTRALRQFYGWPVARIVAAWGRNPMAPARAARVREALEEVPPYESRPPVVALAINRDGSPKHPLYVGYSSTPSPYP
jgi:hypothetical protein